MLKRESYGGEGVEQKGKRSALSPQSCPSGADVEKGEVSCPSMGRTRVSELVVDH